MKTEITNHPVPALVFLAIFMLILFGGEAGAHAATNPKTFSGLVKKAGPSVVNILVTKVVKTDGTDQSPFGSDDPFRDFFDRYFGNRMPREYRQGALGTGFVIDAKGKYTGPIWE